MDRRHSVNRELIVSFPGGDSIRFTIPGERASFSVDAAALQLVAAITDSSDEQLSLLQRSYSEESVQRAIDDLAAVGALVDGQDGGELADAWRDWGEAAWFPHLMTKDPPYHDAASSRREAMERVASGSPAPSPYKCLCEKGDCFTLPRPSLLNDLPLADVLLRRRTSRYFRERPLTAQQVADLLFYTGGALLEEEDDNFGAFLKKCSPSPGARHPTELYCAIREGGELPAGVHHYCTRHHALAPIRAAQTDFSVAGFLDDVLVGQEWFSNAPVVFFFTCVRARLAWKYSSARAYRVVHLESGHYCQTLVLVAVCLGLGAFQTGAFSDSKVEATLGIDGVGEFVMYAAGAGHARPGVSYPRSRLRLSEHLPKGAEVGLPGTAPVGDVL